MTTEADTQASLHRSSVTPVVSMGHMGCRDLSLAGGWLIKSAVSEDPGNIDMRLGALQAQHRVVTNLYHMVRNGGTSLGHKLIKQPAYNTLKQGFKGHF